jgi:tRNA threonylcarbamoyladenosine biosynthesis protein TsaB
MALILSLETSTDVCSVALHKNSELLHELVINEPQAHAARLSPLIEELLNAAAVKPEMLDAVATTSGPGSYTGLRIGVSTAKGLCYGLQIPVISVPTLDLMTFQASFFNAGNSLLCAMIDARRMEVYCQVCNADLSLLSPVEAKVIDENSFSELFARSRVLFFGNGAGKCKAVIRNPNAQFLDNLFPSASFLGLLAQNKFERKEFEDIFTFKPFYLKDFVAKKAQSLFR